MDAIRRAFRALAADESGATAIEYGLIVSLIAVSIIGSLSSLGGGTSGMWTKLSTTLSTSLLS